jgi:hypothetical protein
VRERLDENDTDLVTTAKMSVKMTAVKTAKMMAVKTAKMTCR